ncbi:pyrokinin-1 receptor-like [Limulus polyphemus]|uniref:Pyrokinin-1 receptor-like n=1 Tax=Limulus polyphemus TaxID=6850 RepID=A0ABM1B3V5_LIMPO|nr:pyrokinin-1 receptor-like [Limulus polyphemus]
MESDNILYTLQDENFTLLTDVNASVGLMSVLGNGSTSLDYGGYMGPKRKSLFFVVPMTLVYITILVTGVVGNICTCVVIAKNKYMHTATNYYLFSLAISDLLLLVFGLPQEMYQLWQSYPYVFGEFFCFFRGLTSETSTNASILTITAFTVERYLAICHPLLAHTMSKLSRAVKLIIVIWILAALAAAAIAFQFGIVNLFNNPEYALCMVERPLKHAFGLSTLLVFIFPMSLILVLYVFIALQLRRSLELSRGETTHGSTNGFNCQSVHGNSSRQTLKSSVSSSSRKSVIKMLVAVVVAFFVCYAPFHAQRLMATYVVEPSTIMTVIFDVLTYMSGVLYYVSATINPILYSIISFKFRQAFKETLATCCGRQTTRSLNIKATSRYMSRHSTAFETTYLTVLSESSHPHQRSASAFPHFQSMPEAVKNNSIMQQHASVSNVSIPGTNSDDRNKNMTFISNSSLHRIEDGAFDEVVDIN